MVKEGKKPNRKEKTKQPESLTLLQGVWRRTDWDEQRGKEPAGGESRGRSPNRKCDDAGRSILGQTHANGPRMRKKNDKPWSVRCQTSVTRKGEIMLRREKL
jgi:hypothetical protein